MTVDERFAAHARAWGVTVNEIRTTETSRLGFGTRGDRPVVLKVIRKENGEEWRCGEVLAAFGGAGMIAPIAHEPGAVLMAHLTPGHDLVSLCSNGRDAEATDIIASLLQRMFAVSAHLGGIRSVDLMQPEFVQFRAGAEGIIPLNYVDRAEELFADLCATQRDVRLLHGDLHHNNVLFDGNAGWVAIDPWGVIGEKEFEVGASLRNPIDAPQLLNDPRVIERRLGTYEAMLNIDADRALKWAFASAVLGILWPCEPGVGPEVRWPFALAARSMYELMK
jgi:streptomycin 6-kinase